MKSSQEQLRSRGYAAPEEIRPYRKKSQNELLELLNDKDAVARTAAASLLKMEPETEIPVAAALVKRLSAEKCLYTRLAICEALERGGRETALQMLPFLGKIGGNQHKSLPDRVSQKKSYPLPRDIIARTLAKMPPEVFPVLLQVLQGDDTEKICEILDAVGFMAFYHPELSTPEHAEMVFAVMERYPNHKLLLWKAIQCLCAFPSQKTEQLLQEFAAQDNLLGKEAESSLKRLDSEH